MASHASSAKAPNGHALPIPWVRLRSAASGPRVFKRMILDAAPGAKAGDIVAVYDKSDAPYGVAMYNPRNVVALRLLTRGVGDFDSEKFFAQKIAQAVEFRREVLRLDEATDACRLVHDQGDGLPGLVIDRYGDFFVLEFYSLGMFRQAALLERILKQHFPAARFVRRASEHSQSMEGFRTPPGPAFKARVRENGVLFEVTPSAGYKTGFFCDQRDNRLAAAALARGRSVIDVCAYTGGFGLYAAKLGGARETACVELDPEAHALIRKNANINGVRIDAVCADAFPYLRQMAVNGRRYGFIVLDPYKLIASKEGERLGRQKYLDLNRLAFSLLDSGGILLTCSCSGLLPWADFQQIVRTAAGSAGRRAQIFRKSGAGADHPFAVDFPEGEYLKALWCRAA